jgi:C1A family cysteine protease
MGICNSKEAYLTSPKVERKTINNVLNEFRERTENKITEVKDITFETIEDISNETKEFVVELTDSVSAFIKRTFGAILSRIPKDQLKASQYYSNNVLAGISELPKRVDFRKDLLPVRDQGQIGSCVAQACACIKEYQEFIETGKKMQYSVQFVYDHRGNRKLRGMTEGMTGYDAMTILLNRGTCFETSYPYGNAVEVSKVPKKIYDEAYKFRTQQFMYVDNIDSLKQALCREGPCLAIMPVYNSYETVEFWKPTKTSKRLSGYHAVAIVGYFDDFQDKTNNGFLIRNSWSDKWGDGGYAVLKYSDISIGKCPAEVWSTIDAPNS